jgi:Tol biopolymer transport system component
MNSRETEDAAPFADRVTDALQDDAPAPAGAPIAREGDVLLGKYRVEGVIGAGGMGVVVAATHLQLETRVAIKLLRPGKGPAGLAAARLLREARAAARIEGEHVARVLDVEALDAGTPCIVMERLDGRDLGAELLARGPLPVGDAVDDVLQACEAVAAAHAAGIVHRDLKPSNLFLTARADGSPLIKVLDFGIAKALDEGPGAIGGDGVLTASCAVLGSPVYMSPEQLRSASRVDPRTDVWSLGVILFELLTARLPFEGGSTTAQLAAIAADPPIPLRDARPDAPAGLEAAILRCLAKDVDERMPDVAALARALAPYAPARAAGSAARVEATLGVRPRPASRWRARMLGAAAALVAAVAIAVGARGAIRRRATAAPPVPTATAAGLAPTGVHRVTFEEGCEEFPWWTPDGASIAYDGWSGKNTRVFLLDLPTGARRAITDGPGWQIAPSVSPRGGEIAYIVMASPEKGTYVSGLDGSARRRISAANVVRPSWSPDGAAVWAGGRSPIRIDARTGQAGRSLHALDDAIILNVLELPDGRALGRATTQDVNGATGLMIFPAGSEQGRWLWRAELDNVLELAPGGESVFVAKSTEAQGMELWRVPLDGSPPAPVAGSGIQPTKGFHLSPDGRRAAWSDCHPVNELADLTPGRDAGTLVARPRAGSKGWMDDKPVAIPGTTSMVVLSTRMGGPLRPCVVDAATREPPRCLDLGGLDASSPSPSADGRWLAFTVSGKGVFVAPLDGSAPPRRLAGPRGTEDQTSPTISPDGSEVYFRVDEEGASPHTEVVPFAGGAPRRALEPGEYGLSFSPKGGVATLQRYTHDNLSIPMVLDLETKKRRPLVRGLAEGDYARAAWSPDGARVAFNRGGTDVLEVDVAGGAVLRRFDGGNDQVTGVTFLGEEIVISRMLWVGDIWVADL